MAVLLVLATGWSAGTAELRTAEQVRQLSVEQAALNQPVRLQGVVTFFDEVIFSRFIQDATAGIYLRESTNTPPLQPGQIVEVEGVTDAGEYAPRVVPHRVSILGAGDLPEAKPVTFDQLARGQEDSQFVEISGIVRAVHLDSASQFHLVELSTGGGRLTAYVNQMPVSQPEDLVDNTVRVRGVCSTAFNHQRQLFAIRLMIPRPEDFTVEKRPVEDPAEIPAENIGSLLQFTASGSSGNRVKVHGTVIYHQPGSVLYVQDERHGLQVQTRQETPLRVGDRVEVLGFPAQGVYTPVLQDALYRRIGAGPEPEPTAIDHDEALKGTHDCRLVRIEAKLLDRAQHSREQFLVLEAGDFIFHAYLEQASATDVFAHLENGSKVAVTGVCLIEPGTWQAGETWRAKSFQLLLRSPDDVQVLHAPPWWSFRKVLTMAGALALVAAVAFAWVAILRRRVQAQTEIISQKLHNEAALKERYLDLFENANDMVFTHDLDGRITSINHAGERLLQRRRDEVLSRNLTEFVVTEQRAAAEHWLQQVAKGMEVPTAEWDFLNAAGQSIKLEIGSRLVQQNGKPAEVEAIARDITERRRLEREILEISNREQRRIGHDLHDGVCQQLAGLAYLADILADRLRERSAPEATDAEKIERVINDAIAQTRGVARGLFPVRLEENGLVSALEELASNTTTLFSIPCHFHGDGSPPHIDYSAALHLYYIAQEAVLNAARHGKPSRIDVSLTQEKDRFELAVRDVGTGFHTPPAGGAGMGIRIMRYRARVIGATLDLKTQPGHGTTVTCVFYPAARAMNGNGHERRTE